MSKTDTTENGFLNLFFRTVTFTAIAQNTASTPATNLRISLHTADPTDAGNQTSSETSYGAYARVSVARTTAGWTAATSGSTSPAAEISFPEATSGTATITHFGIGSATSGAGTLWYKGTVTPNISVAAGVTPILTTATTISED